nr:PREDICTED: fibroblast growth factor 19-like [Lepisosteus oculatus]
MSAVTLMMSQFDLTAPPVTSLFDLPVTPAMLPCVLPVTPVTSLFDLPVTLVMSLFDLTMTPVMSQPELTVAPRDRQSSIFSLSGLLELRSLSSEVTVIQGVHTSLYLCMDELGHLRGQRTFSEADCTFTELVLPDGYSLFLSVRHGRAVSLQPARRAQLPPGKRLPPLSQFLPVISRLPPGEEILGYEDLSFPELKLHRNPLDLDSGDPFGSGLELANALLSPAFFSRK